METKAYFNRLEKLVIDYFESAENQILIAVEKLTNKEIFQTLCKKAQRGVKVSLILNKPNATQVVERINFNRLTNFGAELTVLSKSNTSDFLATQQNFCIIDAETVLTGTYSWTDTAQADDESITVISDSNDLSSQYIAVFNDLLANGTQNTTTPIDTEAVRRRLEMIRNLILLGEQDDLQPQISKLGSAIDKLKLENIVSSLESGLFKEALEQIAVFLSRATALTTVDDNQIPKLQFELRILELRLESLTTEKTDIERRLLVFNRLHSTAVGSLIQELLKLKSAYARLLSKNAKNDEDRNSAKKDADDADAAYEGYSQQYDRLKYAPPLKKLDKEQEKELKQLYRRACSLCHPDKVTEDKKDTAHLMFIELQEAFKDNDIERVKSIYKKAQSGDFSRTRSTTLSKVELLKAAISEFKYKLSKNTSEISNLYKSDAVKFMLSAGENEFEWNTFFENQSKQLSTEINALKDKIKSIDAEYFTEY